MKYSLIFLIAVLFLGIASIISGVFLLIHRLKILNEKYHIGKLKKEYNRQASLLTHIDETTVLREINNFKHAKYELEQAYELRERDTLYNISLGMILWGVFWSFIVIQIFLVCLKK